MTTILRKTDFQLNGEKSPTEVDGLDFEIIKALIENPRMTYGELGRKINKSRSTARGRAERLHSQGIIDFALVVQRSVIENFIIGIIRFKLEESRTRLNFKGCPRILTTLGPDMYGYFTILMLGESGAALDTCCEHFKEQNAIVQDSFSLVYTQLQTPHYMLLRKTPLMLNGKVSCQENCLECNHHNDGCCFGCPGGDITFSVI